MFFFFFGFAEYNAAEVTASEVRWKFLDDLFSRDGITRIKRRFEIDRLTMEYYIKNHLEIPRHREPNQGIFRVERGRTRWHKIWNDGPKVRPPSRNVHLFWDDHRKFLREYYISGYLFCSENPTFHYINEIEALDRVKSHPIIREKLKELKLNEEPRGRYDTFKEVFNVVCRVCEYGPPYEISTADMRNAKARNDIIDPLVAEILKRNEDEFNQALEDMVKNDKNNRLSYTIVKYCFRAVLILIFIWAFLKLCFFCIAIKII